MATGTEVICDGCGLRKMLVFGTLMSGEEVTPCACRTCRAYVALWRNERLNEPPLELVCPTCAGPVEPLSLVWDRIVEPGPRWSEYFGPESEAPELRPVGCPACGGELRTEGIIMVD